MRRHEIDQLIPASPDRILRVWAEYMSRGSVGKGYPSTSAGFTSGGISCFDDFEQEVDSGMATSVNTVMNDLDERDYCAISNHYCAKVWKYRLVGDEVEFLLSAIGRFERKAKERGLL